MKGKKLKNEDSSTLTDNDLDIQIGALQEEIDTLDDEIAQAGNVTTRLVARKADAESRLATARGEKGNRGQGNSGNNGGGQGQGNN